VSFRAADKGDRYDVEVDGKTCKAPCDLELKPGRVVVRVRGARIFHKEVVIPAGASTARIHRSHNWLYSGFLGFATATAVLAGAGVYSTDFRRDGGVMVGLIV